MKTPILVKQLITFFAVGFAVGGGIACLLAAGASGNAGRAYRSFAL